MEIYLVGGAVRDKLLNLPITDRDWVVVGSSADEMAEARFKPVGADFPVFLHPETHEEYALARTERKTVKGYKGFEFHASPEVTLEQDLIRRDLTINAIAEDPEGRLHDPCNGEADIKARLLRHVSPAFAEDPVRILRVARLAARFKPLGFSIAPETMALMREMVHAGEVDALVPERVWQEMDKSLALPDARIFFETLRDCGALKIILPELEALYGVPQPVRWHPEIDSGLHTMMALEQACLLTDDRRVRFATVCHDLGKALTPKDKLPSHPGHERAGVPLVETVCDRLKVPKAYRTLALQVTRYHSHVHRITELRSNTLTKLLGNLDVIRRPEQFDLFLLACEADARGRLGLENNEYTQPDRMQLAATAYRSVDAALIASAESDSTKIAEKIFASRVSAVKQSIAAR